MNGERTRSAYDGRRDHADRALVRPKVPPDNGPAGRVYHARTGVSMAQETVINASGVQLGANRYRQAPGTLVRGDDVVMSDEGVIEPRRGVEPIATGTGVTRLATFRGALIGHGAGVFRRSADGATWADVGAAASPSSTPVRIAATSRNLFATTAAGVVRLDSPTSAPVAAGIPGGLDVQLALGSTGTALNDKSAVAYRVAFARQDGNGRKLVGAPSGRATITNTSGAVKDVTVTATIPPGVAYPDSIHVYRSRGTVDANTDPGDELGLVYDGPAPVAFSGGVDLSRSGSTVTATTPTAHGYSAGQMVRIQGGVTAAARSVAIGTSAARWSDDMGASWSSVGVSLPAGSFYAVAWNGTRWVAVGYNVCATSTDGKAWASATIPAGDYRAVAWTGVRFVAVGLSSACAASTDGLTWSTAGISGIPASRHSRGLAWSGSLLVAVGDGVSGVNAMSSPDGLTWTARTIVSGSNSYQAATWAGTRFVAVGPSGGGAWSVDGANWTGAALPFGTYYGVAWSGTALAAVGNGVAAYSADGASWTAAAGLSGLHAGVAWNGSSFQSVGINVAATAPADGRTWTAVTVGSVSLYATAGWAATFTGGEKTIATAPTATTFTYPEPGSPGTITGQSVTPVTAIWSDTTPDGFLGAYLYTNGNTGEGIGNANARPPAAADVFAFRDTLFAIDFSAPASGAVYLLAVAGTNGVQDGDTVTINGVTYTAGSAESLPARQFQRHTGGSIAKNITDTATSFIRVVNRTGGAVTAVDTSDPSGVPGQVTLRCASATEPLVVTFSRASAWSPGGGLSVQPTAFRNGLAYSKPSEPDHFPLALTLVPVLVGSGDAACLRGTTTRDAALVWKEDGLWKVTGAAGAWSVDPLDPTVRLLAPESAVTLNGAVYAFTNQGVVRANESGVEIVSRDIEAILQPLTTAAMLATTKALAFAVAYESDRKYMLWLPSSASDTECTQAWVYDVITDTWTRRTDTASHGIVNPADDRLYVTRSGTIGRERKALTIADYADGTVAVTVSAPVSGSAVVQLASVAGVAAGDVLEQGAGSGVVRSIAGTAVTLDRAVTMSAAAATVYKAIPCVLEWRPVFGSSPGALQAFTEAALLYRSGSFADATVEFRTNVDPMWEAVPLVGSAYGLAAGTASEGLRIRAPVPQGKARGSELRIRYSHAQARAPFELEGVAVRFRTTSTRVSA